MRYYFDLLDGSFPMLDLDGVELAGEAVAFAEARVRARHHGEAKKRSGSVPTGRIRVRDAVNGVVADVPMTNCRLAAVRLLEPSERITRFGDTKTEESS